MSTARDLHFADLICPACGSTLGDGHHRRDEQDQVLCEAGDPEQWEVDGRFGPKTNAALSAMNMVLSEVGRRLTVGQHSRIMQRIEQTCFVAREEPAPVHEKSVAKEEP